MIIGTIVTILVLISMSAFFSGSETALPAASRARMHQLEKDGDKRASLVNKLISDRERLIGAILLGNNLVNILASALATSLFVSLMPGPTGVDRDGCDDCAGPGFRGSPSENLCDHETRQYGNVRGATNRMVCCGRKLDRDWHPGHRKYNPTGDWR